jgi:membrane protease YdiL (CAAX protease family)
MTVLGNLSNAAAAFHIAYFGVLRPWRAAQSHRRPHLQPTKLPPRIKYSVAAIRTLQPGVISVAVASITGIVIVDPRLPTVRDMAIALATFGGIVLVSLPSWRAATRTLPVFAGRWLPRNMQEHLQWAALCVVIGVTEEITWRSVQFTLLLRVLGSWQISALVAAVMFGVLHLGQGRRWMFAAIALALAFHALVWLTGTLYAAMAVHAAIDITAAIYLAARWDRSAYPFVEAAA